MPPQDGNPTLWIINHNAIPPSMGGLSRHCYFSRNLAKRGWKVKIFTASAVHNAEKNMISGKERYKETALDGVIYTFVRTGDYAGNGFARIWNMLEFPLRLRGVCREFMRKDGKPDAIYASSPDLFGALGGLLIARKYKIPCIFEVRDFWPESIVVHGVKSAKSLFVRLMYKLERWMYAKAERIIFTMEGGSVYFDDKGWSDIDKNKATHINNGVDLDEFGANLAANSYEDADLTDKSAFKAVYIGSMRHVNGVEKLVEAAEILQKRGKSNIKLLLFGGGESAPRVQALIEEKKLTNIVYKGRLERRYVPSVLAQGDISLMHMNTSGVMRYGLSANKLFDYLAAGKPVLNDLIPEYDIIERYACGLSIKSQAPGAIAEGIEALAALPEGEYAAMCARARAAAADYDYKALTDKLEGIIKEIL